MSQNREFDLIIYGAYGFTGSLSTRYIIQNYPELRLAIAGRHAEKLMDFKNKFSIECPTISVTLLDLKEVMEMTSRTRVFINTAGPYHRHGNVVIEACCETQTHYCDLTSELFWVKQNIQNFHEKAKQSGTKIIHSAGFASVPSDLGVLYCVSKLKRPLQQIESFWHFQGGVSGGAFHTILETQGMAESDPFIITNPIFVTETQRKLTRCGSRALGNRIDETRYNAGWSRLAQWNAPVVRRSAGIARERNRPYGDNFVYMEYSSNKNMIEAVGKSSGIAMSEILMTSAPLRSIIAKFGKRPGEGPMDTEKGKFKVLFICTDERGEKYSFAVRGRGDPLTKLAALMLCETGVALLDSRGDGGVLTPASGLGHQLIERLQLQGIEFSEE